MAETENLCCQEPWKNWAFDEVYKGGRSYQITADYTISVFVKDNCILPLAEPVEYVSADTVFNIRPKIYGDGGEGCILYEDDFVTFDYEQGRQNQVILQINEEGELVVNRIGNETVRY